MEYINNHCVVDKQAAGTLDFYLTTRKWNTDKLFVFSTVSGLSVLQAIERICNFCLALNFNVTDWIDLLLVTVI